MTFEVDFWQERPAMVADHSIILRHRWEFRMKQEDLENTMLVYPTP